MNVQEKAYAIDAIEASLKRYDQARDRRTVHMIAIALHATGAGEGTLHEFTDAVDSARVDFLTQLARLAVGPVRERIGKLEPRCKELIKVAPEGQPREYRCELVAGHAGDHWCGEWQW